MAPLKPATGEPVVITVATTGSIQRRLEVSHPQEGLGPDADWDVRLPAVPFLPERPDEIVEAAIGAHRAGASVFHIHARDEDGSPSLDPAVYGEIVAGARREAPELITQIGTGIEFEVPPEARLDVLRTEPAPDMYTINAGTFHFMWHTFRNPPWIIDRFVEGILEAGAAIEWEIYDLSHLYNVLRFVEAGRVPEPVHFSFVLGVPGGLPTRPDALVSLLQHMPEGGTWQCIATGRDHVALTTMAMCMGGNVRTGTEDVIFYGREQPVESNAQLVSRVTRVATELGRPVATPARAREHLRLPLPAGH
jgi:3-keto-5-aminohexanoate cleavage enzyme